MKENPDDEPHSTTGHTAPRDGRAVSCPASDGGEPDQLHAQALLGIAAFNDLWMVGLGLFGLHLLLEGYLAYRSGYVPRFLGVLIAVAGLGYLIDSFGVVLSQDSWTSVGAFTFIVEFLLALWLVIWGRRLTVSESGLTEELTAAAR